MNRRIFVKDGAILGSSLLLSRGLNLPATLFPVVRTTTSLRRFTSGRIEAAITEFQSNVKDKELGWLFNNCFPNTLDTTVTFRNNSGRPDTYVITGDIDAMWLRDSSAQVWPYLAFVKDDPKLQQLIAGVINRQVGCILKDPYANAFYDDPNRISSWAADLTKMQPGIHERKWEIDSLCYPIRLAYQYWKVTGDTAPFDPRWKSAVRLTLSTFLEQQRKYSPGPYSFQRKTSWATDGVPMDGYGYPVKPNGLICSAFRPSDDATLFLYLIPSNFFAVVSLAQAAEMVRDISNDGLLEQELLNLSEEVGAAIKQHAVVEHPEFGRIYAYEINGYGSYNLMDDANVPSLLALPYLGAVHKNDAIYANTRRMLLSSSNPFFFKGTAGEGIGGPHAGKDMIWPLGISIRGLTSNDKTEIKYCLEMLKKSHAGTGFMHEAFYKNDTGKFSRPWFAWANTLFGEFLWKIYINYPGLLNE